MSRPPASIAWNRMIGNSVRLDAAKAAQSIRTDALSWWVRLDRETFAQEVRKRAPAMSAARIAQTVSSPIVGWNADGRRR